MSDNPNFHRIAAAPHFVYKTYDSFGILLYVGCTVDVAKRRAAHRRTDWSRFSETLAVMGPWPRAEARQRETEAIDTEAPYFNCSFADIGRAKANRAAAERKIRSAHWEYPRFPGWGNTEAVDAWHVEAGAWLAAVEREQARLKETTHPYLTDRGRLARYLAARQDAALAMAEAS